MIRRVLVATLAVGAGLVVAADVSAGHTKAQLTRAGYLCFNDGPSNWTHCIKAEKLGNPSVPVKVFTEDGSRFLGTEMLLRYDVYKGQPCPQDGLDYWEYLGEPPYYACHHFETNH